jgi:hypothetical protein
MPRGGADAESVEVSGLAPGSPYSFRVRTVGIAPPGGGSLPCADGESSDFAYSTAVTALAPYPPAPVRLAIQTDSASALRVSWEFGGDRNTLLGFEVRRRQGTVLPITEVVAAIDAWKVSFKGFAN